MSTGSTFVIWVSIGARFFYRWVIIILKLALVSTIFTWLALVLGLELKLLFEGVRCLSSRSDTSGAEGVNTSDIVLAHLYKPNGILPAHRKVATESVRIWCILLKELGLRFFNSQVLDVLLFEAVEYLLIPVVTKFLVSEACWHAVI